MYLLVPSIDQLLLYKRHPCTDFSDQACLCTNCEHITNTILNIYMYTYNLFDVNFTDKEYKLSTKPIANLTDLITDISL